MVARFHVFHFAGVAGGDPGWKVFKLARICCGGYAGEIESSVRRSALNDGS
jgi:hypothetical protein